jgi:hypothetical protein
MARTNTRVWYVTDARANVDFTTAFTVSTTDPGLYTVNTNVTRLTADATTGSPDTIGRVKVQEWANAGDVVSAQSVKVAKDEASSTTPPAVVTGTPKSPRGSWGVRSVAGNYTVTRKDFPYVLLKSTSASAVTITIPADADLPFPLETPMKWRQTGAGQITFAGATGVTLNSVAGNKKSSAQFAQGEIVKTSPGVWLITGTLTA